MNRSSNKLLAGVFAVLPIMGLLSARPAVALVAVTNGNYFTGYVDINFPAGNGATPLKFERTYNSRSQYDGMTGYGWGTEKESFGLVAADGSFIVQESGGGERTRFSPEKFDKKILTDHISSLSKARQKKGAPYTPKDLERLSRDADFRDEEGRTLGIAPKLPEGTKLFSSERGDKQTVSVLKDGFLRDYPDGKKVFFRAKGKVRDYGTDIARRRVIEVYRVSRIEDPASRFVLNFKYNAKSGNLEEVNDGKLQSLRFTMNTEGKVTQVQDKQGRKATYKYCASQRFNTRDKCSAGDLVESTDAGGNTYKYEYDNIHNLTKIVFADGTTEEIAYWAVNSPGEGGAKSVKSRRGVLMEYTYTPDPTGQKLNFKTEVKTTFRSGRNSLASYEYNRKRRADGTSYKYRMATAVDGDKTETIYNECCGQPVQITDASGITKFDYFPGTGLPKWRDTPQETTTWEYSPKHHGKVTKVAVAKKGQNPGAAKAVETVFDYNDKGNLERARTSDGRGVALLYDNQNRIKTMIDQEKRKISFAYNNSSKPIEIRQEGVGAIVVVYDTSGNIKEVQPKGGKEVALTVTEAFQNLIEIIKPAGIQPI